MPSAQRDSVVQDAHVLLGQARLGGGQPVHAASPPLGSWPSRARWRRWRARSTARSCSTPAGSWRRRRRASEGGGPLTGPAVGRQPGAVAAVELAGRLDLAAAGTALDGRHAAVPSDAKAASSSPSNTARGSARSSSCSLVSARPRTWAASASPGTISATGWRCGGRWRRSCARSSPACRPASRTPSPTAPCRTRSWSCSATPSPSSFVGGVRGAGLGRAYHRKSPQGDRAARRVRRRRRAGLRCAAGALLGGAGGRPYQGPRRPRGRGQRRRAGRGGRRRDRRRGWGAGHERAGAAAGRAAAVMGFAKPVRPPRDRAGTDQERRVRTARRRERRPPHRSS